MKDLTFWGAAIVVALGIVGQTYATDEKVQGTASIAMTPSDAYAPSGGKRQFVVEASASSGSPVRGTLRVEGSDNFSGGQMGEVKWVLDGTTVTGRLVRNGYVAGSFRGTLAEDGAASGVFMMSDGTPVKWSWVPDSAAKDAADSGQQADESAP